jgi:hydroxymethylpyrimidine/phosphomethylpyrimidine kinase
VDPVLVDHKGRVMFPPEVVVAYRRHMLPLAAIVTPNWREAAILAGIEAGSPPQMADLLPLARRLFAHGARQLLVTGVPSATWSVDFWFDGERLHELRQPWIATENRHGSGDTLSAAICAYLARGLNMAEAVQQARRFTWRALDAAAGWQLGQGHGPLAHFPDRHHQG